ncbi:MIP/aquaporin family protein [Arthrobacter sp. RHLT1-20]
MITRASTLEPPARPGLSTADSTRPGLPARLSAEAFGTFFVVVAGLGVPLFTIPQSNPLSASLAAGLALTAAMLAFGYLSGGHFNPAVTVGHAIAGRIRPADAAAYVGAQLAGALLGAVTLFGILRTVPKISDTRTAFDTVTAGFGENSIIQVPLAGVLLVEVLGAALLVAVYLGTASARNPSRAAAPFAVGLTMAVLLQLGQAIGNTPLNPARATASAVFSSPDALGQLWLFWVAPLIGAALAGLVFRGFALSTPGIVAAPATALEPALEPETEPETETYAEPALDPAADAATPAPAVRQTGGDDDARDFFDKRGE